MEKKGQTKAFMFAAVVIQKINPIATDRTKQAGLKVNNRFSQSLQMPGILSDNPGI
jgi:hypothetical protein